MTDKNDSPPVEPAPKAKATTKSTKQMTGVKKKDDLSLERSFWARIILGVAIIILLFMFVRTLAHRPKNNTANMVATSTAIEGPTEAKTPMAAKAEAAKRSEVVATKRAQTATPTIDSEQKLMEQRRKQYDEMRERVMAQVEAQREINRKQLEEQRSKGGELPPELKLQFNHIEQLYEQIQKEMDQLRAAIKSQQSGNLQSPPPVPQGYHYPPNPWGGYTPDH